MAIGDVRRAKLYYLRGKVGKKARIRELRQPAGAARGQKVASAAAAPAHEPVETEAPVADPPAE